MLSHWPLRGGLRSYPCERKKNGLFLQAILR
jgi:hypothetical protein